MAKLDSLLLSGVDVKDLTGWPDPMVEEWLNIIRNLALLSQDIEKVVGSDADNDLQQAQINEINDRLGSGQPLTWDTTGFTWDTTQITFDETQA